MFPRIAALLLPGLLGAFLLPAAEADLDSKIARNRTGTLIVRTRPGAAVSVTQLRHEYWFGATLPGGVFNGKATPEDTAKFKEVFLANFNAGVIESAFKWHAMEPEKGQVNYATVDAMLEWADANGLPLRGHCIFWGVPKYTQQWVQQLDDAALRTTVRARARSIGARYRDRFAEYDLNNEMIHANYYEQRFGLEFIKQMALWVKDGDPNATLYFNDYDITTGRRLDDYVAHIRRILDMGAPMSGIGVQGHLHGDSFDPAELQRSLDVLAQFKLPIRVTEFNFPGQRSRVMKDRTIVLTPEEERAKADAIKQFFRIVFAHPATTGIMMWGFWEGANWIPQSSMYRRDWTPTPAAEAYRDLVYKQWWTDWKGTAGTDGSVAVRAYYGKHRVVADGKEAIVELKKCDGARVVELD